MSRTYDDRMFIDTFEHNYTWLNGFMRNVRRYGEKKALLDPIEGQEWTYRQLNAEANKLANALRADGVGKNDVVMSILTNCPEFCFTYIGPRKIGAIVFLANYKLAPAEIAKLIDHNEPKVVLYSAEIADMVTEAVELASKKPKSVVLADNHENLPLPEGHVTYRDYTGDQDDSDPVMDFVPHIYDEVVRMCTSGTSALPKSVPLNDINEVLSAHDAIMHYPLSSRDVCLNMTPLFHRGGAHSGGTCPTFYAGATLVLMRNFSPRVTLDYVERYGVTFLTGSPSTLEMLAKIQERDGYDISGLKGIVTMGAPLEKSACIRYQQVLTPNILNGYGTTETFWNSFLRPYDLPEYAGSAGGSCIDDEIRIVNTYPDRKAEPDDIVTDDSETVGEIIIFSPGKSTYSYYKNDEEQQKKFYKGWIYTNDLGTWDKKHYIKLHGRKDDMIVSAAENIYPEQVEEAINEFDRVADCMVVGVPDAARGQAVTAYIVPADDDLTVKDVFDFCINSPLLSVYKRPRWYRLVDKLPTTATGKKQHALLEKQAADDLKNGLLKRK